MKVCRVCGNSKPISEYHSAKTNHDRLKHECKTCCAVRQQQYQHRRKEPDKVAHARAMNIKRKFGIPVDTYWKLSSEQNSCAICEKEFIDTFDKQLDHCHATGRIRKFLCQKCNKALGLFNDNPELLRSAANYVEEYK